MFVKIKGHIAAMREEASLYQEEQKRIENEHKAKAAEQEAIRIAEERAKIVSMYNSEEENRFKTISEFKECIIRGGEPVFSGTGIHMVSVLLKPGIVLHELTEPVRKCAALQTTFWNTCSMVTC